MGAIGRRTLYTGGCYGRFYCTYMLVYNSISKQLSWVMDINNSVYTSSSCYHSYFHYQSIGLTTLYIINSPEDPQKG